MGGWEYLSQPTEPAIRPTHAQTLPWCVREREREECERANSERRCLLWACLDETAQPLLAWYPSFYSAGLPGGIRACRHVL